MPIFPHQCVPCSLETEDWMKSSDPTPACPRCGQPMVRTIADTTHFRLRSKGGDVGGPWTGSQYSRYRHNG